MRLDKTLSDSGHGTRSEVRELVRAGRVQVDGAVVRDPGFQLPEGAADRIAVDGEATRVRRHLHLMLYKPAGYLTALEDAHQPTVADLIPTSLRTRGLAPVGRLDADTTGLLLLTNDGTLGHRLANPKWHVDKVYHAWTEGGESFGAHDVDAFADGLVLGDGTSCQPAALEILGPAEVRLTQREGKYHQVKRMLRSTGRTVVRLHRESVGPLGLDPALAPGDSRELTDEEAALLYKAALLKNPDAF
jgi:16S rRNA pseudouridine516 synthase